MILKFRQKKNLLGRTSLQRLRFDEFLPFKVLCNNGTKKCVVRRCQIRRTDEVSYTKLAGAALQKYDQQKIALPIASSGIAATLLNSRKTAHSAFQQPLDIQ
ncbi:hypothetical protein TNCV_3027961 [Trichonephila clavipes]|nr:hypothetical protein TNCV_3027961 [Trichonephila clavipes]